MKKQNGISLIVLIITVVVIIILGTTIIVNFVQTNIINNANEALFKEEIKVFQEELLHTVANEYLELKEQRNTKINAKTLQDIQSYIPSFTEKYEGKLVILEDELAYKEDVTEEELEWLIELGIQSNVKTLAEKMVETPTEYYGKYVTNYTTGDSLIDSSNIKWRIFYSDGNNIYLITSKYVISSLLPTAKKVNSDGTITEYGPTAGSTSYNTSLLGKVINAYTGSEDITDSKIQALNYDYFVTKGYTSTADNMKAVAYMLDTDLWSKFAGEKADYAIGGPTIEMVLNSYNQMYGVEYIAQATSNIGYQLSIDGGINWTTSFELNRYDELYALQASGTIGMYLASPSYYKSNYLPIVYSNGNTRRISAGSASNGNYGFRPVVCLNSNVLLEEVEDGFEIKNTSKVEYTMSEKKWTNEDVTVTIEYSDEIPSGYELQYKLSGEMAKDWTKYEEPVIITKNNTTIIGRLYNATLDTELLGSSVTISNIDKNAPTTPSIGLTVNDTIKVSAVSKDLESGLNKYQYSIDNITWQDSGTFSDLTLGTEYTVYAKSIDNVGNESEVTQKTVTTNNYGKYVTNYLTGNSEIDSTIKWKILYSDSTNIYLIADNYIPVSSLPTNGANNKPENETETYPNAASFANVYNDYIGTESISDSKIQKLNYDYFINKGYTSTSDNMKAVAYMLDTDIWSTFVGENADYAIGGPTIEMIMNSYNSIYYENLQTQAVNEYGYKVSSDGGIKWEYRYQWLSSQIDELYEISSRSGAYGMWLASPSGYGTKNLIIITYNGEISQSSYSTVIYGFRPVVCLNSSVELVASEDGYVIK